ncbi:MAG: ATP-dependent acyl-CoA ligase [Gemmatimonadaceae bacterium]
MRDLETLNVRDFLEEAARRSPDAIFLLHDGDRWTYAEFNRQVDAAAARWRELGVRKGDRVAFMLENRPEFLQYWFGLAKLGGILVAINTRWQAAEVEQFLTLTEPRCALVGEAYRDVFHAASTDLALERLLTFGSDARYDDIAAISVRASSENLRVPLAASDVISFISTSGTTGRPKAVMQTHGNFVLTGEGYATWVELQPTERIYLCLPLFHINSQAYTVMGAIAARATIVLVERFSASRFWSDMSAHGVNVFNHIGSMLVVLMKRNPTPEERNHAVRLTYGGPALPGPVREEVEERFGLTVISGIGMSETTFGLIEPLHQVRRSGSLGTVRQHPDPRIRNEARVVDDAGADVPRGEVGELLLRSPVHMKGYYRNPEQTATTIRNGWLHTGDLVRQDDDGYFYFVDRKKDIIRVRGENVASSEVEDVLNEHPLVLEVAVIGVPSELTDDDIAAFVVLGGDVDLSSEDLRDWCRTKLASFKLPRYIWQVDALPKTETLRTEKHQLRADTIVRLQADTDDVRGGGRP